MILSPHLCKQNQTTMNHQQSTSISRNYNPENRRGAGVAAPGLNASKMGNYTSRQFDEGGPICRASV